MIMLYNFQISSMIEIEVELDVDVIAAEAVSNVVYAVFFLCLKHGNC